VRRPGDTQLGTRCEIKNLNSFRFLQHAIEFETRRQIDLIEDGHRVVQETRLYDPDKGETRSMRTKEDAQDYRYFPDPDLPPLVIDEAWIERLRSELPELPEAKRQRFVRDHSLSPGDASTLSSSLQLATAYEDALRAGAEPRLAASWIVGEYAAALNREQAARAAPVSGRQLAELLSRIQDGTISGKIAKEVFEAMWAGDGGADSIIEQQGLRQISDANAIEKVVDDVLLASPAIVAEYRAGKQKAFQALVGKAMAATAGKANPLQLTAMLKKKLSA
jgi:aspartyl-tRNA(Asn)/glutamyl-tRNA(Gln) amidotransferase subunit B